MQPIQLRLLHILAIAFLSSHLGISAYADSKELFDEASALQAEENYANDDATSQIMDKVKRSWKSLQGSWGKRSVNPITVADDYDTEPEWTENVLNPSDTNKQLDPEAMKYFIIYASSPNALATAIGATSTINSSDDLSDTETPSDLEKKSWKNMNVAWGKRRSAVWNKFRGAWGKREPAWNNLKGMWGKRSPKDWKKLQSSWGKRNQQQNSK